MSFSVVWLLTAVLVYNILNPVSAWTSENFKGIDHIIGRLGAEKIFNKSVKVVENTSITNKDEYHIKEHPRKKNEQKTINILHSSLNSLNRFLLEVFRRRKRGITIQIEDIICDEENVLQYNCYWFSVQNFNNGGSAEIRKCQQDFIFQNYYRKTRSMCKLLRQEFYDTQYFNEESVTNESKLYKHENYIGLVKRNGTKEILLVAYHQWKIFNVKDALINTEENKIGVWKINKIEYEGNRRFQKKGEYIDMLHSLLNPSIRSFATFGRKKRQISDDNDFLKFQDIGARSVRIDFIKHKVSLLKKLTVRLACISTWCKESVPSELQCSVNSPQCKIDGLQPFTEYNITFIFCSKNQNCNDDVDQITTRFKTKPTAPSSIKHLEVYSKNESSISLRWEPPYPPTGTLSHYKISYFSIEKTKEFPFPFQPCRLWPNVQCYTLIGLQNNSSYTISLQAANQEDPDVYGQISNSITVITVKEPSEAPYDLDVEWNVERNLVLKWKHPNITNGDIQFFNITLTPTDHKHKTVKKVLYTTDRLQYCYEINEKELSSSVDYIINITAYNGFDGKESLPSIPLFSYVPKPKVVEKTIAFELSVENLKPEYQKNLQNYGLFVFISNDEKKQLKDIPKVLERFKLRLSKFKFLYRCTFKDLRKLKFNIGRNDDILNCDKISNYFIDPDNQSYNVTVILTNTDRGRTSYKIYSWSVDCTKVEQSATLIVTSLIIVVILLLILVGLFIVYFVFKKRICLKKDVESYFTENSSEESLDVGSSLKLLPFTSTKESMKKYSKCIKLSDLEEYVKQSVQNGELERQYKLFPSGQTMPWNYGALEANRSKNRYVNLIAYDHSRVVLQKVRDKEYSDYINANYIDGYRIPKAYIATQAPKLLTGNDFWRMIWQNNVRYIIMLADVYINEKKIHQYWPEINDCIEFDDIIIKHASSQIFADYVHRIFHVSYSHQTRTVQQFHFMAWPAHNVPIYPQILIPFLTQIHQLPLSSESPMVVHCDAGVGRTGTVLLCDICLRMIEKEKAVDVLKNLYNLRSQRANLVNSLEQYKLVHLVILGYMFNEKTSIPCNAIGKEVKKIIKNEIFKLQMEYLEDVAWKDDVMKSLARKNDNINIVDEKNRIPDVIPEVCSYVSLSPYPSDDDDSTYINAITVESFRIPNRFIVTQQPLPNTVGDFWRLVHEQDISLILSLNSVNLNDPTSCIFWPSNCIKPVDYLMVSHENTLSSDLYDKVTVLLKATNEQEGRIIEIMVVKNWPPKTECPNNINNFLDIVDQAHILSRLSKRVIVTCYDGVTASGLYVAMDFIVEKIKFERVCDVCEAVRSIRRSRKQFVRSEEQFVYLYKAAAQYIQACQGYSNFS